MTLEVAIEISKGTLGEHVNICCDGWIKIDGELTPLELESVLVIAKNVKGGVNKNKRELWNKTRCLE